VSRHVACGASSLATLGALALGAGLPPRAASAQAVPQRAALVSVSIVPETVTVGEPFTVRIRVRAPKFATIRFPAVPDTADAIEAIDPRATQDAGDADMIDRTAIYRLVAWDVGQHTPRFANVLVGTGGASQQYPVALQPVTVRSLLPDDTLERVPKDVRDPVAPPGALWKVLLLAALLAGALAWFWRRRRVRRAAEPPLDVDPFVAAQASFEALDALGLPAAGEPGRHVIASVDLLRGYLARRFPEMRESLTVDEMERAVATSDLPVLPQRLNALLRRESSLRFARAGVTTEEALALAKESQAIVRDVQTAYDARVRAMERRPRRGRRQ
jgi:hypothetical protein